MFFHVMHFRGAIKESLSRENTAGAQLEVIETNRLAEFLIKLDHRLLERGWLGN